MTDNAPALKTLFKDIGRRHLKQIFAKCNVALRIDWTDCAEDFEDKLCHQLSVLAKSSVKAEKNAFVDVCTILFDINAVCRDQRQGRAVLDQIKAAGRIAEALGTLGVESKQIHCLVAWVYLNMPDLWEKLRKNAVIQQAIGLGGVKKYIEKPSNDEPTKLQQKAFEDEFLDFMKREHTMISFVHTDREDLGNCVRYVFHVNAFPKNVEQYDDDGKFLLALDHNAEGFTIVHYREAQPFFRLKCFFSNSQKKRICQIFAKYMLATEIIEKPPEQYPIKELNPKYDDGFHLKVTPDKIDKIDKARVSGVCLEITDPESGSVDELIHRCHAGDVFERLTKSCENFPVAWREVKFWEFVIGIVVEERQSVQQEFAGMESPTKDPKVRTYTVKVTERNLYLNCNDENHKKLILDLLADNGIRNVYKKEILSTETRK